MIPVRVDSWAEHLAQLSCFYATFLKHSLFEVELGMEISVNLLSVSVVRPHPPAVQKLQVASFLVHGVLLYCCVPAFW